MKCINPDMKKLVNLYQFDLLPAEDKIKVEAHLLECESCFQELYRLSPALEVLEKAPDRFLDAVQSGEPFIARLARFFNTTLIQAVINWWQKPAARILIPAAITALLLIIFTLPTSRNYSDLAVLEKAPYQALKFKGDVEFTEAQQLFTQAMTLYNDDDYDQAIQKLSLYVQQEPENIYGHFYLAVCFLLRENHESGIRHLEKALSLSRQADNQVFMEKCYWYLGNAYLVLEKEEEALFAFRNAEKLQGTFVEKAVAQIKKIEDLNKR
jgi:tetratricopeptide (TPR) repeat protein